MRKIFIIALNDVRIVTRDVSTLVWMLLFPLLFMFVFGTAFRESPETSDVKPRITVIKPASDMVASLFMQFLREDFDVAEVDGIPDEDLKDEVILELPENMTKKILETPPVPVLLTFPSEAGFQESRKVEALVFKTIVRTLSELVHLSTLPAFPHIADAQVREAVSQHENRRLITLDVASASLLKKIPSGFMQSVPGNLVMFVLMILLVHGGAALAKERQQGVFSRLTTSATRACEIIAGKITGRLLIAWIQLVILLVVARLLFGISFGNSPLGMFWVITMFSLCTASMAMFFGCIVKTPSQASTWGILFTLIMSALGGCWWPLEIVPQFMQYLGFIFPTAWAVSAFQQIMNVGAGVASVYHHLLVMGAYTGLFLIAGTYRVYRMNA